MPKQLITQQKQHWSLAAKNYKGLEKVEEKHFDIDGITIKVQFNPERIRSSAAKVDKKSIAERKCFLCVDNLPSEQKGIGWEQDFMILVNPFPILKEHFTIIRTKHVDQLFFENIESMLKLAKHMQGYSVFYNGPKCGASAPDHMHFQAGESGFMPIDEEYEEVKLKKGKLLHANETTEITHFDNYLRKMISLESSDIKSAQSAMEIIYSSFAEMQQEEIEPMINVICRYTDGKWTIHFFPRKLHRPSQYFEEGDKQILLSPASVDFGGVFITPRREDFEKITVGDIKDIFNQVSVDNDFFEQLKNKIQASLK